MSPSLWQDLVQMVELATRAIWAPTTDDRTRLAYRTETLATLRALAGVGKHFDEALSEAAASDLSRRTSRLPRGTIFRAEVKERLDAPEGKYLLLAPLQSGRPAAVQADDLMQLGGRSNLAERREPADGSWVLVCGMALAPFDDGKHQGLFVLPLEWMPISTPAPPDAAGGAAPPAN